MLRMRLAITALALTAALAPALAQQPSREDQRTIETIRRALIRLPYYGVFDFLVFSYEKGTVTLTGYAYRGSLKSEAEAAVKRQPRVDEVVNNIEELPASQNDDRIRWATFYNIYTDDFLQRYNPSGAFTRADRFFDLGRYPGMQPLGMYPIHIVVKNGRTQLLGAVDNEADKTVAGLRAREVPGTFGVENELVVSK